MKREKGQIYQRQQWYEKQLDEITSSHSFLKEKYQNETKQSNGNMKKTKPLEKKPNRRSPIAACSSPGGGGGSTWD